MAKILYRLWYYVTSNVWLSLNGSVSLWQSDPSVIQWHPPTPHPPPPPSFPSITNYLQVDTLATWEYPVSHQLYVKWFRIHGWPLLEPAFPLGFPNWWFTNFIMPYIFISCHSSNKEEFPLLTQAVCFPWNTVPTGKAGQMMNMFPLIASYQSKEFL